MEIVILFGGTYGRPDREGVCGCNLDFGEYATELAVNLKRKGLEVHPIGTRMATGCKDDPVTCQDWGTMMRGLIEAKFFEDKFVILMNSFLRSYNNDAVDLFHDFECRFLAANGGMADLINAEFKFNANQLFFYEEGIGWTLRARTLDGISDYISTLCEESSNVSN